jgi:short-subunit dehydrogenase
MATRPPIDNGTVLITGASAGIGRELARQLAPRARTLVLVARRAERLGALRAELLAANPELSVYLAPCDLSDPGAVCAMLEEVLDKVGDIDILVNNAGLGNQNLYERADWARVQEIIQVNVLALALLTHRLVGPMVARGRGGILNIGSGAGLALLPGAAAYVGSKHFVNGFTETLRLELTATGVAVTRVCPGPVDTEFDQAAGIEGFDAGPPIPALSAAQCAREALRGFEKGSALVFPGFAYRSLMILLGVLPRALQRAMLRPAARRLRRSSPSSPPSPPPKGDAP